MNTFFKHRDPAEKKYIFNSFLVFVILVEAIILGATCIWQIDEGWLGGEVRVVPFPWREYLLVSFAAPIVMMFLFGLIIKGFDVFGGPEHRESDGKVDFWRVWRRRGAMVSYTLSLLGVVAFAYALWRVDKVLPFLKRVFSLLGLWGTYIVIGVFALALLYIPLSLLLRYRLQKRAMEYQYLLALAERHGLAVESTDGKLVFVPPPADSHTLPSSGEVPQLPEAPEHDSGKHT